MCTEKLVQYQQCLLSVIFERKFSFAEAKWEMCMRLEEE